MLIHDLSTCLIVHLNTLLLYYGLFISLKSMRHLGINYYLVLNFSDMDFSVMENQLVSLRSNE